MQTTSGKLVGLGRLKLDRRWLEAGHLRYAILNICSQYHDLTCASLSIAIDVGITLQKITPVYFNEFTKKYAGT